MNRGQKEEPMIYGVFIYRTDGNHIKVIEDSNYDACFAEWQKLQERWTNSVKEQQPFTVTSPVVTAFSPTMIYEITLLPINTVQNASKSHNPYYEAMHNKGFSQTFPTHAAGTDLLSR